MLCIDNSELLSLEVVPSAPCNALPGKEEGERRSAKAAGPGGWDCNSLRSSIMFPCGMEGPKKER